jgi:hypothetical protein
VSGTGYIGGANGLILSDGSITDVSGSISFGNENLSTTGNINASLAAGTKVVCAPDTQNPSGCDYTVGATDAGTRNSTTSGTVSKGVIDTAIDALPAGGGTVILRPGTYYLYSNLDGTFNTPGSIVLDKANVTLHCDKGAYLEGKSTVPGLAKIDGAIGISASNVTFEGCEINAGANGEIVYAITTAGAPDAFLSNIKILNNEIYGGTDGITTHWTEYSAIEGNYIHDQVLSGLDDSPECIEPENGSRYFTITNNKMYNCGSRSFYIHTHNGNDGMDNITFSNNIIIGNATTGSADSPVVVSNGNSSSPVDGASHNIIIANNQLVNTYIKVESSAGFNSSVIIEGNDIRDNPDTTYGSIFATGDYYSLIIKGNAIYNGKAHPGIEVYYTPASNAARGRLLIEGNTLRNSYSGIVVDSCTVANISNNLIDNNIGTSNNYGIDFGGASCIANITGNTIIQQKVGIRINAVTDDVLIADNLIKEATAIASSYGVALSTNNTGSQTVLSGNTVNGFTNGVYLGAGKALAKNNFIKSTTDGYDVYVGNANSVSVWTGNTFEGGTASTPDYPIMLSDVAATISFYDNTFLPGAEYYDWGTSTAKSSGNRGMVTTYSINYGGGHTDYTIGVTAGQHILNANYFILSNSDGAAANLLLQAKHVQAGKVYTIDNGTTSAVTFKVSGQTGATIAAGKKAMFMDNGTNVVKITADF